MTHINEDALLKYALEVVESDPESAEIAEHLSTCADCQIRLKEMQNDIGIIGNVRHYHDIRRIPTPRHRRLPTFTLARIAAVFVMGIFIGLAASHFRYREPANVSGPYIVLSPPEQSHESSAASDATGIPLSYYDSIKKSNRL